MEYMADKKVANTSEIREAIANYFFMPEEKQTQKSGDDRNSSVFQKRVNDACEALVDAGLLERVCRGKFALATKGERALEKDYYFDTNYVKLSIEDQEAHNGDSNTPPIPKVRYEFAEVTELEIEKVAQLITDVRFANMAMQEQLMLAGDHIVMMATPVCRASFDSEAAYVDAVNAAASSGEVIRISEDKKNNKTKIKREGHSNNKKPPKDWKNPNNFAHRPDLYADLIKRIKGCASFADMLNILIKEFKIQKKQLSRVTGIPLGTIENYCDGTSNPKDIRNIFAIAIAIGLTSSILIELLDVCGFSTRFDRSPADDYYLVFEMHTGMTKAEINQYCVDKGITTLFDINDDDQEIE